MAATVVTITSGKGGVGKSTTTANVGVALAARGKRVLCVDGDIGLRNMDVIMGLENQVVCDLVDVVEGRCLLKQALIQDRRLPELYLIPAAQARNKTAVAPSDMVRLCDELRPEFDWILIDSSAGIERGFRIAIAPADRVLIVTNPEIPAVRDAGRVAGLIEAIEKGPAQLILNRVKPDMGKRGDGLNISDVLSLLSIDLIGLVPEDEHIVHSSNRGMPVALNGRSQAGEAFRNIARRLQGETVPLMKLDNQRGFVRRLARLVGSGDRILSPQRAARARRDS